MKTDMYRERGLDRRPPRHCCYHKSGSFSKGLFWGAIIGGILGVLFAPDKGEETRKKIKKTAKEYEEKGKETLEKAGVEFEKAKEKASPYVETAKEKFQEAKVRAEPYVEVAKEKASKVKTAVEKSGEPVLDTVENIAESLNDEADKIRKRYFKGVKKR